MAYDVWQTCILVPGFSRGECASWVQAIGSILAIVGAFVIAFWQSRKQREADAERMRLVSLEKFYAISMLLTRVQACIQIFRNCLKNHDEYSWEPLRAEVELTRAKLNTLPVFELPSWKLVGDLSLVDQNLRAITTVCSRATKLPPNHVAEFEAATERWDARLLEIKEWCRGEIAKLHTPEEQREAIAKGEA